MRARRHYLAITHQKNFAKARPRGTSAREPGSAATYRGRMGINPGTLAFVKDPARDRDHGYGSGHGEALDGASVTQA